MDCKVGVSFKISFIFCIQQFPPSLVMRFLFFINDNSLPSAEYKSNGVKFNEVYKQNKGPLFVCVATQDLQPPVKRNSMLHKKVCSVLCAEKLCRQRKYCVSNPSHAS